MNFGGFGGGFGNGSASGSASGSAKNWIFLAVSACLVSLIAAYLITRKPKSTTIVPVAPVREGKIPVAEDTIRTDAPDQAILSDFDFQPRDKPGYIPGKNGKLVKKPAGQAPFKLVQCGTGGYAVRWMGLFLTLGDDGKCAFGETKQEPDSCWTTVPGYCGGDGWVMLRSRKNNAFLRYDPKTLQLVCQDSPTGNTALTYCWKLVQSGPKKQPCGTIYSQDLKRVVNIPCNVKKMPRPSKASCSTVTAGYQAECCVAKKHGALTDSFCRTAAWPETVGRTLNEAMLYLRTRRPDLILQPCPSPCTVSSFPEPTPNTIVIPYDPRTNLVTAAARRLI